MHGIRASAPPANPNPGPTQQLQQAQPLQQQQLALQQKQMEVMQQLGKGTIAPGEGQTQLQDLATKLSASGGGGYSTTDSFSAAPAGKAPVALAPPGQLVASARPAALEDLQNQGGGSKPAIATGSN